MRALSATTGLIISRAVITDGRETSRVWPEGMGARVDVEWVSRVFSVWFSLGFTLTDRDERRTSLAEERGRRVT